MKPLRILGPVARIAPFVVLAMSLATSAAWAWGRSVSAEERRFPHQRHAKLFPSCETCHSGIATGNAAMSYPSPSSCADCHDGVRYKRVAWEGPQVAPSNLLFSHVTHERVTEKETPALECRSCHGTGASTTFMAVGRATPTTCLGCHAHQAREHLDQRTPCAECHVPLPRATALSDSAVAAISIPDDHRRPQYASAHGPEIRDNTSRCAVCHARESCARCHPNATDVSRRASLGSDARVARLVSGRAPSYFKPASHDKAQWQVAHGDSVSATRPGCASCHARPSCRTCHIGAAGARQISRLAGPDQDAATGVQLRRAPRDSTVDQAAFAFPHAEMRPNDGGATRPGSGPRTSSTPSAMAVRRANENASGVHGDTLTRTVRPHPVGFVDDHGAIAASGTLNCLGCHEERTCSTCHNGGSRRRFHAFNFVSRHAASAVGRERDCTSCHNTETFCRACHSGQGREARGTGDVAYHDRQPLWLLQHGQAARQELQTCVSCHQQRTCMRCHSDLGLRVNPHGPGFDAERMAKRNRQVCLACHLNDPLRGRP